MPTLVENRDTALRAARTWAKEQGYRTVDGIPPARAAEAIAAVAAETGLPPVVVREALLKRWSDRNDQGASALSGLGAGARYQGAADHRPLSDGGSLRPMGALLAARGAPSGEPPTRARADARPATTAAADVLAERQLSHRLRRELRTAFGDAGARLYEWPTQLSKWAAGAAIPPGAVEDFRRDLVALATGDGAVRGRDGPGPLPAATKNELFARKDEIEAALSSIVEKGGSPQAFALVFEALTPLLVDAAAQRGVFMKGVARGELGAVTFRAMRPAEVALEKLKDEDPDAYAVAMRRKQTLAEWEQGVRDACAREGLEPRKAKLLGQLVTIGTDRKTGEEVVFSPHWGALPKDDFLARRTDFLRAREALRKQPEKLEVKLEDLPRAPVDVRALQGPVRYASLTDDLAKDDPLTRVLAVKSHEGRDVVAEGKYAGVYVDALIQASGRLVEGRAFVFDERLGRAREVPLTAAHADKEPYVSVSTTTERGVENKKLYLQLPNNQGEWTDVRQAIRALSRRIPSIRYEEGSKNTRFTFEPKDFAVVRETLGGMALSSGALDLVRSWFEDLAEAERATSAEHLPVYGAAALGGFKTERVVRGEKRPVELTGKQMQALAWLEANGDKGVCALDTGMGKTLVAIAQMQRLVRDRVAGGDEKFLFVCPPSLRGNLAKEIHAYLQPEAAEALLKRVDVMSYGEFRAAAKSGKSKGRRFDAGRYASVFFDEAQALKNPRNEAAKAALALDHPRKVCLTASPMEKNPMEAYVLAAVSNNTDLSHPAHGKELRREMRKFKERFCETFGGRIVGVVKDPTTLSDLHTWVKRNVFYADKRDASLLDGPDVRLPELRSRTDVVVMSPAVEAEYRKATKGLSKAMGGMVSLFRDKGLLVDEPGEDGKTRSRVNPAAKDEKIAGVMGLGLREAIKRLNDLANMPEKLVPGAGYPKIDRASEILIDRLRETAGSSRAVLFSDDREMVLKTAEELSKRAPAGKIHAACLNDEIRLFKNGRELDRFGAHELPFKPGPYRRDPSSKPDKVDNRHYPKAQWQQFVLAEMLGPDREVLSATMLGQTYQTGQNLQAFDTCIHLDRDTWCSEDMRQRTARVWRTGQDHPVWEVTLDAVYAEPRDGFDATLDEVRKHHQVLEGELFDTIVKGAQTTELGAEWFDMDRRKASFIGLDKATLELMSSPFVSRSRPPGEEDGAARVAP